jgi:hypothetical protein
MGGFPRVEEQGMLRALLGRWREGKAIGAVEAGIRGRGVIAPALDGARRLREIGSKRSVPVLCEALDKGAEALRVEAAAALAAVHKRCPDTRVLGALNAAILTERQPDAVREAAIEALTGVVDVRHEGSLVDVLKKPTAPVRVRAAAIRGLLRHGYPEAVERLAENCLFDAAQDPKGAIRRWVIDELKALDDKEKLSKLHEIVHSRRRLRYRPLRPGSTDPAAVVALMAEVDPEHSVRYLSQMVDDSTKVISAAAAAALRGIREKPVTQSNPSHPHP